MAHALLELNGIRPVYTERYIPDLRPVYTEREQISRSDQGEFRRDFPHELSLVLKAAIRYQTSSFMICAITKS